MLGAGAGGSVCADNGDVHSAVSGVDGGLCAEGVCAVFPALQTVQGLQAAGAALLPEFFGGQVIINRLIYNAGP